MRARPAPPSVRRWRFAFRRSTALAVAATVLLAPACSDDDPSAADTSDDSTTTSRPTTTEAAEDSGSGRSVRDELQATLTSYDEVISQIVADPAVAADRDHPLYDELRGLMTPGNTTIDPVINALISAGSRGERQVAEGEATLPVERRIEGEPEAVGPNRYQVLACSHLNYRVFDRNDQPVSYVDGYIEPSRVTIARVDREFRIESFESVEDDRCSEAG